MGVAEISNRALLMRLDQVYALFPPISKDKVAMVPMSDLNRLRALEDREDIEAADAALAESSERISYEEIRAELGL